MSQPLSDVLSAASLLLAVEGVLYGMWYPEIVRALAAEIPKYKSEREKPRSEIFALLSYRAIPLLLIALPPGMIFLPDAWQIASATRASWRDESSANLHDYDSVRTAFCFVVTLCLALGGQALILSLRVFYRWVMLWKCWKEPPPQR